MLRSATLLLALAVSSAQAAATTVSETYKTKEGGLASAYTLHAPRGARDLLIWFHADGGGASYDGFVQKLGPSLARRGLATLAVRVPTGTTWHGPNGIGHIYYVQELLTDRIHGKHRVPKGKTYLAGASGGAVFITGQYLPVAGHGMEGGAVLLCGGVKSLLAGGGAGGFPGASSVAKKVKLHFKTQKADYIHGQVKEAVAYFRKLGFAVTFDEPAGGGHCAFDVGAEVERGLEALGVR